jgi:hypothetical protein
MRLFASSLFASCLCLELAFAEEQFGQSGLRGQRYPSNVRRAQSPLAGTQDDIRLVRSLEFADGFWPDQSDAGENQLKPPETVYGPPPSEPRKTLFQWSYGTSFGGAPDLEEPLVTDRPDFTEASSTVGKGVLQIESGYTYIRNKDPGDNSTTHSIGEVLFRYGVFADWFEFRIQVLPLRQTTSIPGPSTTTSGLADLHLGVKIGLTPQEGFWPEMAITPQMFIPTGSNAFTSGDILPGVNWLYGWDVNDVLAIGASTQFNNRLDGTTGSRYTEWAQSITFNYSLAEDVGAYTEWFVLIPSGADTEQVQHYMDGGFTYRLTPDVQFDVRAGFGLSGASDDFFAGTGVSIRLK